MLKKTECWNDIKSLFALTVSWRGPLSYRNQSIDLQSKELN